MRIIRKTTIKKLNKKINKEFSPNDWFNKISYKPVTVVKEAKKIARGGIKITILGQKA